MNKQEYLTNLLDEASKKYYNGEDSGISDTDFDIMLRELFELEKANNFVYPNSPTQRVGSDIQDGFKKGAHPSPMLTIENTYNDEGLQEWADKMHKENYGEETYLIGTKFDGVSLEVKYVNGVLVQALTRGDKNIGDDVTENARTIRDIPLTIPYKETFYVRGEVMLPKTRLEKINAEREANGEEKFSNCRNACSGSLKQLNPKVTAQRGLIFRAWDCIGEPINIWTMDEKLEFISSQGFNIGETMVIVSPYSTLVRLVNEFKEHLDNMVLDYDYDGVVVKINQMLIQNRIGTKDTRAIEWGIARKWNDKVVETVLLGVDWQVGRTGVLTPVARLEPVECGGVTVTNATLHNLSFIRKNDIMKYDWLKVVRSGDVIPYIEGVDLELREGSVRYPIEAPVRCPICGSVLEYEGELIKCINVACNAQITGKILQFCSKDCMDIKTIGEKVAEDLVKCTLVDNYWDLYKMGQRFTVSEIVDILGPGYGTLSVSKMLSAIEDSKKRPFECVLAALSIPGVGKVTGRILAKEFKNIDALASADVEQLKDINGIGEVMVKDIHDWFDSDFGQASVEIMKELGLNVEIEEVEDDATKPLAGLTVCFTGKPHRFQGDDIENFLETNGAKCTHSVSKSMDFLITGEKPGSSKVQKATDYGVPIITEDEFYKKFDI